MKKADTLSFLESLAKFHTAIEKLRETHEKSRATLERLEGLYTANNTSKPKEVKEALESLKEMNQRAAKAIDTLEEQYDNLKKNHKKNLNERNLIDQFSLLTNNPTDNHGHEMIQINSSK